MNKDWRNFLERQSALITQDEVISFGEEPGDYPALRAGLSDLTTWGVLAIDGSDSRRFLQGQSTCDAEEISAEQMVPGAICNPKGRMLCSFIAVAPAAGQDALLLLIHRELITPTIEKLSKYAAFYKADLRDASEEFRIFGLAGPDSERGVATLSGQNQLAPMTANQIGNLLIGRCSSNQYLALSSFVNAQSNWQKLAGIARPVGTPYWDLHSIRAGLATVTPLSTEQFVPQMLNLQAVGAVNFKKGCYTGQEVVARMQYLGKLKRRGYRLSIAGPEQPLPGSEICAPDNERPVGTVLSSAPADSETVEMFVVLQTAAADLETILINGQQHHCQVLELPYSLDSE